MKNEFTNRFNEWLMATPEERAKHNPFIECLEESAKNLPIINMPQYGQFKQR